MLAIFAATAWASSSKLSAGTAELLAVVGA